MSTRSQRRFISRAILILLVLLTTGVFSGREAFATPPDNTYTIQVNPDQQFQTIQGWGTSLAWWANIVGAADDAQRVPLADTMFDPQKGIGLNVLRYNIGADTPGNTCHDQMREGGNVPAYETAPGQYDWSKDANQRWFLQSAQARGADQFEGFVDSAPAWMLLNSCTAGGQNGAENLSPAHYDDYVNYLTAVAKHFHDQFGMPLSTLEPFNEPTGSWWTSSGNQEGMAVSHASQNTILNKLGAAIAANHLGAYTGISAPDDNSISWSLADYQAYDASARAAIAQYNTHGYYGSDQDRLNTYNTIAQTDGKRLRMSEWGDGSKGSQIGAAIALSNRILEDEQIMHPSSWVIWQAVNTGGGDNTDLWGLAYRDANNTISYPSRYYAMGNYSKFVRPGYKMIGNSDPSTFTAYNAGDNTLVLVATNNTTSTHNVTYDLSRFKASGDVVTPYRTSATENLAQLAPIAVAHKAFQTRLPVNSITTFVVHHVTYAGAAAAKQVDDGVQGNGLAHFSYAGSGWSHCHTNCGPGNLYNQSISVSSHANDRVSIAFKGSSIRLFGEKAPDHGIGLVSIDHGPASEVDLYAARTAGNQYLWESPHLSNGVHTLTLQVTERKNPQSSGTGVALDRVEIDPPASLQLEAPQHSLLTNADFETGNLNGWQAQGNPDRAWVDTSYPHSGTYDGALHPTASQDVAIYQNLRVPASGTYALTAYAAANITSSLQLGVDVNGATVSQTTVAGNVGYSRYTLSVQATRGQTIKVWYYAGKTQQTGALATLDDVMLNRVVRSGKGERA